MDRITTILRFQWRAYWRRFKRRGNLTTNNAGVWVLIGGIGVFKYSQQLPIIAAQLARGETRRYEALLLAMFVVWMFPVMAESWRSISSRGLLHTPLTTTDLFLVRLGSVFVSPASWIVAACSFALVYPLSKAPHTVAGITALLFFVLISLAMSMTIAHALSSAHVRKALVGLLILVSVAIGVLWIAKATPALSPSRLVAYAAVAPNSFGRLALLAAITIASFGLALWSFGRSLEATGARRSQRFNVLGSIEFPGRFSGLLRKDLRYFVRLLDLYFALPIVVFLIFYLVTVADASASMFRVGLGLLLLPGLGVAANFFGLDAPSGLDRYSLFPLNGRDILISKNVAFMLLFFLIAGAIFPFALWRFGIGVTAVGLVELLLVGLANLTWGNWMSVRDPFRMQFYRFSSGGSPTDAIIGMFFGCLPGAIIVTLLYRNDPGAAWKIGVMALVYVALYYLSLTRSARRFDTRREQIRQALS